MIILDVPQLSEEWFAARVGNPGASSFDKIVTSRGEPSKQYKTYLYGLAAEILSGQKIETYQSAAMQRGIELEAKARQFYEFANDAEVEQVGLCYRDEDKKYHCSPDGLVDGGGLEIKCPTAPVHIKYLVNGKLPTEYVQQVQGSLFITGKDYWDFLSYYPGVKSLLVRVEPDLKFHAKLHEALEKFCDELAATVRKLQ